MNISLPTRSVSFNFHQSCTKNTKSPSYRVTTPQKFFKRAKGNAIPLVGRRKMTTIAGASDEVENWVEKNLGKKVQRSQSGGGSSWASCTTLQLEDGQKLFVKVSSDPGPMFEGEAAGLKAMYATDTVRVPNVLHAGPLAERGSFIVMENLDFGGRYSQAQFGELLARMHLSEPAVEQAKQGKFGFQVNNTIGGTSQPNKWTDDWVEFFREQRIRHQIKLARDPTLSDLGNKVCDKMDQFFEGIEVKPSILHGDLWSGNVSSVDGMPAIFDPACYYGHHEAEFGMSWCANFNAEFYKSYHNLIPKEPGFEERRQLYLLYHYLNHYNLFGGGYYNQALSILRGLA